MKASSCIFFISCILILGCGEDSHSLLKSEGGLHVHTAPHNGKLFELGEHGAGFNFELHLNSANKVNLYVLDAHAENFVRIKQQSIEILLDDENNSVLVLNAMADPATGETIGDTSHFQCTFPASDILPIDGTIHKIEIGTNTYNNQSISFSGNPQNDTHEH